MICVLRALDVDVLPMRRYMRVFVLLFISGSFFLVFYFMFVLSIRYAVHLFISVLFFRHFFLTYCHNLFQVKYIRKFVSLDTFFLLLLLLLPSLSHKLLPTFFYFKCSDVDVLHFE